MGPTVYAQLILLHNSQKPMLCNGPYTPLKGPFSWEHTHPHLIHGSLGLPDSAAQNGISIGSAVFAQLTAECRYILLWTAPFPRMITPSHGGSGPHLTHDFLANPSPEPKRHLDRFSRFFAQVTAGCPCTFQLGSPQNCP